MWLPLLHFLHQRLLLIFVRPIQISLALLVVHIQTLSDFYSCTFNYQSFLHFPPSRLVSFLVVKLPKTQIFLMNLGARRIHKAQKELELHQNIDCITPHHFCCQAIPLITKHFYIHVSIFGEMQQRLLLLTFMSHSGQVGTDLILGDNWMQMQQLIISRTPSIHQAERF